MKTILFSADFTRSTTDAINWASLIAQHYGATVVLLHVQSAVYSDSTLPVAGELAMPADMPVDLEPASREQLENLAHQLQNEGITCQTDLRHGALKETILLAAAAHQADLIITGRSHMNNFFERLAGTSATGIAQGAHCPVLVVPEADTQPATQPMLQTIIFSTSLEFDQPTEFQQVVALVRTFGAVLRVLHVRAENQPALNNHKTTIARLQTIYGSQPMPVDTVDARTVSGGVETYLASHPADLLVMTTRERDFLTGLLNPSLTGRLLVQTNLPMLIFQAKGDL